jgi:hypothetical protein
MLSLFRGLMIVSALMLATPALADETDVPGNFTLTGNVAVVSQYRSRGLAQSDNQPALQATINLSHVSGFYATLWGSSAKAGQGPIVIGDSEIDIYAGYSHEIGRTGLVIDGGVTQYIFPNLSAGNYTEIYATIAKNLGPVTAKSGVAFVPAQRAFDLSLTSPTRNNIYLYGDIASGVPGTPLTLHGHLGHTAGGFDYGKAYFDYTLGVTYNWRKFALDASLMGTDISRSDITRGFLPRYLNFKGCDSAAACTMTLHRMAKPVGVVSLTANF